MLWAQPKQLRIRKPKLLKLEGKNLLLRIHTFHVVLLSHGCEGSTPNAILEGVFDKATELTKYCISDVECDGMENYSIFNHFVESATVMDLVPECRSKIAPDMPGFTCGSDPTLRTGTKIVVRGVPETNFENDNRQVKLLKTDSYDGLEDALNGQSECPDHDGNHCATINHFNDGCNSAEVVNGLAVFNDPFHQPGCKPNVTNIASNGSMMEEYKLYLGYDDLIDSEYGTKSDSHKVYEISCKIAKIGSVDDEVIVEQQGGHVGGDKTIETDFFIEKYFGDITDENTRRSLNDTEVIPFSPNADSNDRFQFRIWSDHPEEYVHLETCSLSLSDGSFNKEFIKDGCIQDGSKRYFGNKARISRTNEDWFNMHPLLRIGSCKSTWQIDCTVASCKRGLDVTSPENFCKAGDQCADRYTATFMGTNARRRRSEDGSTSDDSSPPEAHVKSNIVHPCFFVDKKTPRYCVDTKTCWTLQQCAAAFPNDFPQESIPEPGPDSDLELHQIMEEFEAAVQEHIQKKLTENQEVAHDHIMASIRDNANRVLDSKQTFEDAVEEIIRLINTL